MSLVPLLLTPENETLDEVKREDETSLSEQEEEDEVVNSASSSPHQVATTTEFESAPPSLSSSDQIECSDFLPSVNWSLLNGCRKVGIYRQLNKISEGTYGCVYKGELKDSKQYVALKYIKYHEKLWQEGFPLTSLREISILLNLKHPNIVNIIEVVVGTNPNHVYMVLEYIEHELKILLDNDRPCFSISERKTLLKQLLEATAYMHSNWVIHRDLKTSNLLYSNKGLLKVCDFGMARKFGDPIKPYTHNVITMWYRAPELLLGQIQYSEAVDLWSVGCIMAELFVRQPLFSGKNEVEVLDKIFKLCGTPNDETWPKFRSLPLVSSGKIEFGNHQPSWRRTFPHPRTHITELAALSENGLDLLSRLLCLDPEKRIKAQDALDHPFFREMPLPQRPHLMPTVPETNASARRDESLNERDLQDRDSFYAGPRFLMGSRVNPARYLVELEAETQRKKQTKSSYK